MTVDQLLQHFHYIRLIKHELAIFKFIKTRIIQINKKKTESVQPINII